MARSPFLFPNSPKKRSILGFVVIFLAYFLGNFGSAVFTYYQTVFPIKVLLVPCLVDGFLFTLSLGLSVIIMERYRTFWSSFMFPALGVSYLSLLLWMNGGDLTILPIASQSAALPIIQIASVTGLLGISFITLYVPASVAFTLHYHKLEKKHAIFSFLGKMGVVGFIALFGLLRLDQPLSPHVLKVGLFARDPKKGTKYLQHQEKDPTKTLEEFIEKVESLADLEAKYILGPEGALLVPLEMEQKIFSRLSQVAQKNEIYLFAPLSLTARPEKRNALYVFSPEGRIVAKYNKMHLVGHFEEGFTPGTELSFLNLPEGKIGLEICHDMDFTEPSMQYAKGDVGALFVPANDFGVNADGKWHAEMAILQSVAYGVSLARSASFGFLSISDPYGRILSWKPTIPGENVSVIANMPLGKGKTLYTKWGNWFSWVNALAACFFIGLLFQKRNR